MLVANTHSTPFVLHLEHGFWATARVRDLKMFIAFRLGRQPDGVFRNVGGRTRTIV